MALSDEQADILGGPILQRPDSGLFSAFSRYHLIFKLVTLLGLGLLVWTVCARGLEYLRKHRELRYRKAMRRKHGIPDSDCRPFAVAYAAAKRAHLEREAKNRKKATNHVSNHNLPPVDQRTDAQKDMRGLRRRVPETTVQLHDYQLPGKYTTAYDIKRPEVHSLDFVGRYNPDSRHRATVPEPPHVEKPSVRCSSRKDLVINVDNSEDSKKRSFEDDGDARHETMKKSRIDGDQLINGDDKADWYAQYGDSSPPLQASKESLNLDGEESSEHVIDFHDEDEAMEGITSDEITGLKAVARGKKRDRAEAGSSFGGDDDDDIRSERVSHHRKRRTILRRTLEAPVRGRKRDREAESPEDDSDGSRLEPSRGLTQHGSKKKRGKKAVSNEDDETSEVIRASKDPLRSGRRVGDEWEADGVHYKVSDTGERLRLTLVKKARNKYHMPQDSQHPDRSVALEIYVETWLTDEQYKRAEEKQELAWQEASRESSGSKTPDVLEFPTQSGKNLLWDSIKGVPTCRPSRQSMLGNIPTRTNPFEQWELQPTLSRRVASSNTNVSPMLPAVVDGPTRPGFRGFSKWEKQDREAEALARIRAKIEEQSKVQESLRGPVEVPAAPEIGAKALSVPTITLTPAPAAAAEGDPNNSIAQSKTDSSASLFVTPSGTDYSTKSVPVPAPAHNTTGLPQVPAAAFAATSSTLFHGGPPVPTTASTAPLSQLSFTKPQQVPASTFTTASSPAMPNPPGKETSVSIPSTSPPSASVLGITTKPLSTENATKSSFAKPNASSSTSSPVTVPLPTTKTSTPNIDVASSSSLATFGSIPTSAGPETSVPPSVSTSAAPLESLNSTTSLFPFSSALTSSSTSSTATQPPPPSVSAVPKFSFGQPSTTSVFMSSSNPASGTTSQPKMNFRFGQTTSGAVDGHFPSKADEFKKSTVPASVFGALPSSNEPVRSSPFGTTSAFRTSTSSSPLALSVNGSRKQVAVDGDTSVPKPTLVSAGIAAVNDTHSSTSAGPPPFGNKPVFLFSGTLSSKPVGGSQPTPLFGDVTGGFGSSSEKKPTFPFSASAEGLKPSSVFGGSTESSKPTFGFGSSAESSKPSVFGSNVEGSKSTFTFNSTTDKKSTSSPATENPKSFTAAAIPKSTSVSGTAIGSPSPPLTFTFGKRDDGSTNASTSASPQLKPGAPFTFGASSGASSMFGQPSTPTTSGDSSQSIFGKPTGITSNAFGFTATGNSGPLSSTFTFGKPAVQNQKQEQ